ncbi:MAG: hypothetical protein JST04_05485 [Bdellovibrionales bacterium]|nr:hypothetical protein [Bdellovibrionales bacterium]
MKIPASLSTAFGDDFQATLLAFALENELLPDEGALASERFLTRSVIPHVERLSTLFNRIEPGTEGTKIRARKSEDKPGLDPYWKESSNPENFRLAYFLAFMPSNAARAAAVVGELSRLGFRYPAGMKAFRGIEWGAGPASGAVGIAAGVRHADIGVPREGNWALIEQDRAVLSLGEKWATKFFESQDLGWSVRPFHRKVDWTKPLLPASAPSFHLWLSSFFLNEAEIPLDALAARIVDNWEHHLEDEGLAVLIEPALRVQSRRLLEFRKHLLVEFAKPKRKGKYRILLPCLGHQACGALATEGDWCHEEITWWRPKYFRKIDELAGLDRKTLPFSYLVVAKSKRSREELLPALGSAKTDRLVSPAHSEGRDLEFFVCGEEGKRRARYRPESDDEAKEIERGSIFLDAEIRGDARAGRVDLRKGVI